ncbi:MAG: alanine racemase [Candidatus Bathyarchaeia archaeon]
MAKTVQKNPNLVKAAAKLHRACEIPPDTYVMDLDTIRENSIKIYASAKKFGLECYFCAKQFGRNPLVIKAIMDSGIQEAMAMDIEGVKNLHRHGIPIAHVGHFGQIPTSEMEYILQRIRPRVITVFSVEKAKQISTVASRLGITQSLLIKVLDDPRLQALPTGGGFAEHEALDAIKLINQMDNVKVVGTTTYPAFNFSVFNKTHHMSDNFEAMMRVVRRMENELGIRIEQVNAPGRNCVGTMELAAQGGATHVEPGHSFTGTLPNHAFEENSAELPAVVYVTEVSHHFNGHTLAYGDSYMTTAVIGSLKNDNMYEYIYACIGNDPDTLPSQPLTIARPQEFWYSDPSWFMYCSLMPKTKVKVGDTVVFGFRPQIYRTQRGRVAVVTGVQTNKPRLLGLFDRTGVLLEGEDESPVGYDASRVSRLVDSMP